MITAPRSSEVFMSASSNARPGETSSHDAGFEVMTVGRLPRDIQDRVAGTWLVPR
jgi:hypothetical protein